MGPRDAFLDVCTQLHTAPPVHLKEAYREYANKLFDTATALMLPSRKDDLGKHCFGYAYLLATEFYADSPQDQLQLVSSNKPNDELASVRDELDADWAAVQKDGDGRVTLDAFKSYFLKKNAKVLVPASCPAYEAFLDKDFESALAMMLPAKETTLGGHCFRYGALMAGEFYFGAAQEAAAPGCGCNTHVA